MTTDSLPKRKSARALWSDFKRTFQSACSPADVDVGRRRYLAVIVALALLLVFLLAHNLFGFGLALRRSHGSNSTNTPRTDAASSGAGADATELLAAAEADDDDADDAAIRPASGVLRSKIDYMYWRLPDDPATVLSCDAVCVEPDAETPVVTFAGVTYRKPQKIVIYNATKAMRTNGSAHHLDDLFGFTAELSNDTSPAPDLHTMLDLSVALFVEPSHPGNMLRFWSETILPLYGLMKQSGRLRPNTINFLLYAQPYHLVEPGRGHDQLDGSRLVRTRAGCFAP